MKPGDVLVAPSTGVQLNAPTPAWTPLFAMASAVVTDIGGPLSHGSIVAREYGIPAGYNGLGTGVATRRIHSGDVITVDGSAGVVMLGYGMMLPIVPFYIERKGGAESNWDCSPPPPR